MVTYQKRTTKVILSWREPVGMERNTIVNSHNPLVRAICYASYSWNNALLRASRPNESGHPCAMYVPHMAWMIIRPYLEDCFNSTYNSLWTITPSHFVPEMKVLLDVPTIDG